MDHYNDLLPYDKDFEVLHCAQFFVVEIMTSPMIAKLKKLNRNYLLTKALAYSIEELISHATNRVLQMVPVYMNKMYFKNLSPLAVEHLLKLRLDTSESNIFIAFVWWMQKNPEHSHAFPRLLELIELHLLDDRHWDMLFKTTELIDRNFCQTLLNEQRILAQRVQKVVDQNLIKSANNIRLINGMKTLMEEITSSSPSYHYRCITIDLKQLFVLNCLKFELKNNESYVIFVSKDMREWECIINYYGCYGQQILYFDERVVRFINIRFRNRYPKAKIKNVEALYSTDPFEFDPITTLNVPKHNLVHMKMLLEPYIVGMQRYGDVTNDHVTHKVNKSIVYHFSQPYIIGSMKLLLNEESSYYVEVASRFGQWNRVFAEENVSGWRIVTFVQQPVLFVKIVGTKAPTEYFHLYKFECPARCNTASTPQALLKCINHQTSERMRRMLRRKYLNISRARCLRAKG
uniref:BACK domain-containing protein n=1 Tax=Panagrellus redivivus TaxID=6233 RepID=A0A7E4W7L2_PANRE